MPASLEVLAVCEWTKQDEDNVTITDQINVRECSVSQPEITFTLAAEIGVNTSAIVQCSTTTAVTFRGVVQAGAGTSPARVIVTPNAGGATPEGNFVVFAANPANIPST